MIVDIFASIVVFIITFTLVGLLYRLYTVRKLRKDKNNLPSEVLYILNVYKIKKEEVDLDKLIRLVILVTTFIFSLAISVALYGDDYGDQLTIGLILMIPLIFISYHFIGKYAKKKFKIDKKVIKKEGKKNGYKKNRD